MGITSISRTPVNCCIYLTILDSNNVPFNYNFTLADANEIGSTAINRPGYRAITNIHFIMVSLILFRITSVNISIYL